MTRDRILAEIRATAAANEGLPLGERAFQATTGINRTQLRKAGFPRYRAAVEATGLVPNELKAAIDTPLLLQALGMLTRRLGKFPTKGEIKVARAENPAFPSYEAFFRLSGGSFAALPRTLLDYCRKEQEFTDVASLLEASNLHLQVRLFRRAIQAGSSDTFTSPSTVETSRLAGPTMSVGVVARFRFFYRRSLSTST